jgi:hypothetical protein
MGSKQSTISYAGELMRDSKNSMPIWDEKSDEEYRASALKLMGVRKFKLDAAFDCLRTEHSWSVGELFE